MAGDYQPILPKDFDGKGLTIDTNDPRYKAVSDFGRKHGLSQEAFSELLGVEARGVLARQASQPAPAPAPAAPSQIKDYDRMSFSEKLMAGHEARKTAR